MGNMHLVTGYAGQEHITAADQGAFHTSLFGSGQYVLGKGNRLAANVISNNVVRVLDGDLLMQGRYARLNEDTYADLTVENGEQGMQRHDLIVARYTRNTATGVEDVNLVVIKGTSVESDPVDPEYTDGDLITAHDAVNDMPLYRLVLDGLNVGEPVQLFTLMDSTLPSVRDEIQPISKGGTGATTAEKARENLSVYSKDYIDNLPPYYTEDEAFSAATKGEYGYKANAVPDTAMAALAPLLHYWWRRNTDFSYSETVEQGTLKVFHQQNYAVTATWYYGDGYEFDTTNGTYSLTGTVAAYTMSQTIDADYVKSDLVGKYIATAQTGATRIYYITAETTWGRYSDGGGYSMTGSPVSVYCSVMDETNPEYFHSPNADSISENDEYASLGLPLLRALCAPKFVEGSYIGTGTYGSENPNKLTFDFEPKILLIASTTYGQFGIWFKGCGALFLMLNGSFILSAATLTGKEIEWYYAYDTEGAYRQMNYSEVQYNYLAIG